MLSLHQWGLRHETLFAVLRWVGCTYHIVGECGGHRSARVDTMILTHAQKSRNKPKHTLCGARAKPSQIVLGGALRRDISRISCKICLSLHEDIMKVIKRQRIKAAAKPDRW